METRANYALIGAFTIAGFVGLVLFLMWFAKLEIDRQFAYYDVDFPEVSGLSVSSSVLFAGLTVGQVVSMDLSPSGDGTVRVRIEVAEDTPVRSDSRASLSVQGVTGVSNVAITAGSPASPLLRAEGGGIPVIQADRSVLQALSDQGPQMIERLNTVAAQLTELFGDDNQQRVTNILSNIEQSSGNLDKAMADITTATTAIASAADNIAGFGDQIGSLSDAAKTTLGNVDTTLARLTDSADNVDNALVSATSTLDQVRTYVEGDLSSLTQELNSSATSLRGLADRAGGSMDGLDQTIASAGRAFDGADRVLNTDIGPVVTDLRQTLANLDAAIASVTDDLPAITGQLRSAATSADTAFASLRGMVEGSRGSVQSFAQDGLPQITRMAADLRGLVDNVNQLVSALRRNPSQILTGPRAPEFRR